MAELKPKKRKTIKRTKPKAKEIPVQEEKKEESWEDYLDEDNFDEEEEDEMEQEEIIPEANAYETDKKLIKEEAEPLAKVGDIKFPALEKSSEGKKISQEMFGNIPVEVTVELGRTNVSLKDVYELSEGSIIELERLSGEPLDLVVNGQIVARGEVVAVDNNYGLRITKILTEQ